MPEIIVNIVPPEEGRGPHSFSTKMKHDAETVIPLLKDTYQEGRLEDCNGYWVPLDPKFELKAGKYFFTLQSRPEGETHSLSWHSQTTRSMLS